MDAPNKIYVEVCEDGIFAFQKPPFAESVEYVRADLIEQSLQQEQPEVDLEKELEIYLDEMNMYVSSDDGKVKCYNGDCVDSEGDYLRVFKAGFDLGLNARKDE